MHRWWKIMVRVCIARIWVRVSPLELRIRVCRPNTATPLPARSTFAIFYSQLTRFFFGL